VSLILVLESQSKGSNVPSARSSAVNEERPMVGVSALYSFSALTLMASDTAAGRTVKTTSSHRSSSIVGGEPKGKPTDPGSPGNMAVSVFRYRARYGTLIKYHTETNGSQNFHTTCHVFSYYFTTSKFCITGLLF